MRHLIRPGIIGFLALLASLVSYPVHAQAADLARSPSDPWPRQVDLGGATATVYQPQVESWDGNRIRFRAAVGLSVTGAGEASFGTIWATAVTRVDRVSRLVTLDAVTFSQGTFPTLADGEATYLKALQAQLESVPQTVALDRLQASLAARDIEPRGVAVQNVPPRVFVSDAPAILVSISGAPVLRAVPGTPFERVINTRALIVRDAHGYYLRLDDGWMTADALDGRWQPAARVPSGLDRIVWNRGGSGEVDLPAAAGAPTVFVSLTPAALVVFEGEPELQPISGTTLLRAANTTADVIVDIVSGRYFMLLSGRWFRAPGLNGPWTHVPAHSLPRDFARIPAHDAAGAVLVSVAGTPQAKAAAIESSIPQTATVLRVNGPTLAPELDGHPQYRPIAGTPLSYVVNSPTPIIRVAARSFFAVQAGIWFEATSVFGPWAVAGAVPEVIYTIPASSPLHHVTYVRVYSSTREVVEVGYTPGYTGAVVTPEGVVVYGTGHAYAPWVGNLYYPPLATYGTVAQRHGSAMRNIYVRWGNAVYTGSRSYRLQAGPSHSVANGRGNGAAIVQGRRGPDTGGAISDLRFALGESFKAANAANDHYADGNGSVYRSSHGGWEKQTRGGWQRATPEESSWADREQQAHAAGADAFQRHRYAEGVDRLAEERFGHDARGGNAFEAIGVRVGGLPDRRRQP